MGELHKRPPVNFNRALLPGNLANSRETALLGKHR